MHPTRLVVALVGFLMATAASATMPELSELPRPPSFSSCEIWAKKQDSDALSMWGTRDDGGSSVDLGLSRLIAECLGEPTPDIVTANSSAGAHEEYCEKHRAAKMCKQADVDKLCAVADPSPTPLNYRANPNGIIRGSLQNGAKVRMMKVAPDSQGKTWVYVVDPRGAPLGWVFRNYIDCS